MDQMAILVDRPAGKQIERHSRWPLNKLSNVSAVPEILYDETILFGDLPRCILFMIEATSFLKKLTVRFPKVISPTRVSSRIGLTEKISLKFLFI